MVEILDPNLDDQIVIACERMHFFDDFHFDQRLDHIVDVSGFGLHQHERYEHQRCPFLRLG